MSGVTREITQFDDPLSIQAAELLSASALDGMISPDVVLGMWELSPSNQHPIALADQASGELLAAGWVSGRQGANVAVLAALSVAEGYADQGYGRQLLQECEAKARALGATTLKLQARGPAQGFFEKMQYERSGESSFSKSLAPAAEE